MKLRLLPALLACALLALAALAVGCSSGGGGTIQGTTTPALALQEYFQRVQDLSNQSSQRLSALEGGLGPNGATLTPDEALKVIQGAIPAQAAILKDLRDGLQQLQPPPEAKKAHQEAIDALTAFIDFFSTTAANQAATATNIVDVAVILNSKAAQDANTRLKNSCLGLQQAAASHGITIDLTCAQ